jgi:hypothetical protein
LRRDGLDGECARQAIIVVPRCGPPPDARPTGYPTASAKLYSARVAEPEGLSPDQHECRKLPTSLPRASLKYRDRSPINLRAPAHGVLVLCSLEGAGPVPALSEGGAAVTVSVLAVEFDDPLTGPLRIKHNQTRP